MQFIDEMIEVKEGRKEVQYEHPLLEDICGDTYGVMIYQEQVQNAAKVLAGYTLGGADILRRAMGKKKQSEMDKQRATFVEGSPNCFSVPAAVLDFHHGFTWWPEEGPLLHRPTAKGDFDRILLDVVAAGLEEVGKDDGAADGAGVGNVLAVRAVEAALVAACGVDVGEEALVGVLVAEGPLPANRYRSRPDVFGCGRQA